MGGRYSFTGDVKNGVAVLGFSLLLGCAEQAQKAEVDIQAANALKERETQVFLSSHPCPATGKISANGVCDGFTIGMVVPERCGGKMKASNLYWQNKELAKEAELAEKANCGRPSQDEEEDALIRTQMRRTLDQSIYNSMPR